MPDMPPNVVGFLPERIVEDKRLGRAVIEHDPRSRRFAAAEVLGKVRKRARGAWYRRGVFDQGQTSSCVFQTQAGLLVSSPLRQKLTRNVWDKLHDADFRYEGYRWAQRRDPWEGEEPAYYGTSNLAGCKAAIALDLVPEGAEYRWIFNGTEEMNDVLERLGSVGVGTVWMSGFDRPDDKGIVRLTGTERGGHAWQVVNYEERPKLYTCVNSWGTDFGLKGRFKVHEEEMQTLLDMQGEAFVWVFP